MFTTRPIRFLARPTGAGAGAPIVQITTPEQKAAVEVQVGRAKSDLERTDLAKDKTGVFTGAYAINPVSGAKTSVLIADYVLAGYGTGAIMAYRAMINATGNSPSSLICL